MKRLFLIPVLVLVSALGVSVCNKAEPKVDVNQLEELPKEIANNLKRVPGSDVLVSIAPIATPSPTTPKPVFDVACSQHQDFWIQVGYPVTICTPPNLQPDKFMADAPPRSSAPEATTATTYKLSAFEGKTLATPFGCQTRRGPWVAIINRTRGCSGATSCSMVILGVPSCPSCPRFSWGGDNCESENRPAEVQFIDPPSAYGPPGFLPCNSKTTCGN